MNDDHERILELLAGSALLALDGEDAVEADQLLYEHVPACFVCRTSLADFRSVAGDLALATTPVVAPDLVLARIRRGIADVPVRRRGGAGLVALAASVAALVGIAGFSLSLGSRVTKAESQRGTALEVLNAMQQPGANPVALQAPSGESPTGLVEVAGPSLEQIYLYGGEVPSPTPGNAYQVWLGSQGAYTPIGDPFVPEAGLVLLEITVDPSVYDEVLITEEPLGAEPTTPTPDGGHSWRASIGA